MTTQFDHQWCCFTEGESNTKFLGVYLTEDLSWSSNTPLPPQTKKSQTTEPHYVCFLFPNHWKHPGSRLLHHILQEDFAAQRASEKIIGTLHLTLQDINQTLLAHKALSIKVFFRLLPSGRRMRSIQTRTSKPIRPSLCWSPFPCFPSLTLPPLTFCLMCFSQVFYFTTYFYFFMYITVCTRDMRESPFQFCVCCAYGSFEKKLNWLNFFRYNFLTYEG